MRLRSSTTSPFVRKVRVVAIETGQDRDLDLIPTMPSDPASGLGEDNPLNKIPALILDDKTTIYDSRVICEYLDSRPGGGKFFPAPGPARWRALRRQALADGMMDAAVLRMMEIRRPENYRFPDWDRRQKLKMDQGLAALATEDLGTVFDIGTLSIAIMLDYFDFRFAAEDWRGRHPRLAAWRQAIDRLSLQATMPRE